MKLLKYITYGLIVLSSYEVQAQIEEHLVSVDHSFPHVEEGKVLFADLNKDGNKDVILFGLQSTYPFTPITQVFLYLKPYTYTQQEGSKLPGIFDGDMEVLDVDKDGDLDVFFTGLSKNRQPMAYIAINNGKGKLTLKNSEALLGLNKSSIGILDYNQDGYQDVLINGLDQFTGKTLLYLNSGQGQFTEVAHPFPNVYDGDILIEDLNKDGYKDVIISGLGEKNTYITSCFMQTNKSEYSKVRSSNLIPSIRGNIVSLHLNDDEFPDLLINGESPYRQIQLKAYINQGQGEFNTLDLDESVKGSIYGEVKMLDATGDILITGWDGQNNISKLYTSITSPTVNSIDLPFQDRYSSFDIDYQPLTKSYQFISTGKTHINKTQTKMWNLNYAKTVDVSENEIEDEAIKVYQGAIVFETLNLENTSIEVFDVLGRNWTDAIEKLSSNTLGIKNLPHGIYYLKYKAKAFTFIVE